MSELQTGRYRNSGTNLSLPAGVAMVLFLLLAHCSADARDFIVRKKTATAESQQNRSAAIAGFSSVLSDGRPLSEDAAATYLSQVQALGVASLAGVQNLIHDEGAGDTVALGIANVLVVSNSSETREQLQARVGNDFVVTETKDERMIPETPPTDATAAGVLQASTVTNWGLAKSRVTDARTQHDFKGDGVKVAVIDTGIDANHRLISANVDRTLSRSFRPGVNTFADPHGHGTHVAGIIAATDENIGAAPKAKIVALRVTDNAGNANVADMLRALEYAIADARVQIVNISMGSPDTSRREINDAWQDLFAAAHDAGICVCVAAGNDGLTDPRLVRSPGSVFSRNDSARYGITVGATTANDMLTRFTTGNGDRPDLVAPGDHIVSLRPGQGTIPVSGTSQATPLASGILAIAYSMPETFRKTPSEYRQLLRVTAQKIDGSPARLGAGRVDALAFLNAIDRRHGSDSPRQPDRYTGVRPEEHQRNIETLTAIRDFWRNTNLQIKPPAADEDGNGEIGNGKTITDVDNEQQDEFSPAAEELRLIRQILLPMAIDQATMRLERIQHRIDQTRNSLNELPDIPEMTLEEIERERNRALSMLEDPEVDDLAEIREAREALAAANEQIQNLQKRRKLDIELTELQAKADMAESVLNELISRMSGEW